MATKDKLTPVRKQYLSIKSQYPDAIVFFRLGDFYETFDGDAEIASRELDIVLTSRNVAKGDRVPMAGIPYHAVENYLARLIERGYHVAICEQIGSQPVKGLVPRKVVRVVTPGTVVEPGLLAPGANNYLACVVVEEERAGIGYVDITTGEFAATELRGADIMPAIRSELIRLGPAEILVSESLGTDQHFPGHQTRWPAWRFEMGRCEEALLRHFEVASLDGFGLRAMPLAIRAAGAILQYVEDTQRKSLKLLVGLNSYQLSDFMVLDASTRRNLELTETLRDGGKRGSLLGVLDHTVTAMGGRLLRRWVSKPLLDVSEIRIRLGGVDLLFQDGLLRGELRKSLRPVADLERLVNRVVGGTAQPRDLVSVRETLARLPALQSMLPSGDGPIAGFLKELHLCERELDLLRHALAEEPPATLGHIGIIRPGYSAELDGVLESNTARSRVD